MTAVVGVVRRGTGGYIKQRNVSLVAVVGDAKEEEAPQLPLPLQLLLLQLIPSQ